MDQHGDALDAGEHLLSLNQAIAVPHLDARGQSAAAVCRGVISGDEHFGYAICEQPGCHLGHLQLTGGVLPPSHRDGSVPQEFVGDVGTRSHGARNRQLPAVEIGAVAQVLEDVLGFHERRHADPLRAFLAHARHAHDVADSLRIHEQCHGVAADAGTDHGAVGYLGGTIVRAAGTEIRRAALFGRQRQRQLDAYPFGAGGHQPVTDASFQSPSQRLDEVVSGQRAERDEQRPVVLVGLADDARMVRLVVQGVLQQRFDVGALLLNHEDLRDAASEVAGPFGAERDGHAHPHEPHSGVSNRFVAAEAQASQRLANLAVGDARGHDRYPGIGRVDGGVVQAIGRCVRTGQLVADLDDLALDVDCVGRQEIAVGPVAVRLPVEVRDDRVEPVGIQQNRCGAVRYIGHDLEAGPQARRPRHRNRVAAEVERFGGRARIEHGDMQVSHRPG